MRTIVVLGMHRSGTSAITHALGLLGAEMGAPGQLGQHWEHQGMRAVNVELLDAAGGTWDGPPPGDAWVHGPDAAALAPLAAKRTEKAFRAAPVAVWKDPRTCLTLPFWLPHLGADPVIVMIIRHPVEVHGSLAKRNAFGVGHAFALWERYNADALRHAAGRPTVVVDYFQALREPTETITELAAALAGWGVELPNDPATTDTGLVASQRHHAAEANDRLDHPAATGSQRELFGLLQKSVGAYDSFPDPGPLPEPSPLSLELMAMAAQARRSRRAAREGRGQR